MIKKTPRFFSFYRFFIGFCVAFFVFFWFYNFYKGNINDQSMLPHVFFDSVDIVTIHKYFAQFPRYSLSETFNLSSSTIHTILIKYVQAFENKSLFSLNLRALRGNTMSSPGCKVNHIQKSMYSLIFSIQSLNPTGTPLIFTTHFDTPANTPGSYDDSISFSVMLGIINSILKQKIKVNRTFYFIFFGHEEIGHHSSNLFFLSPNITGHVVSMKSFGAGRPFGLFWKASKSSSVIRSLAKIKPAVIATFFTDFSRFQFFKKISDIRLFDKYGFAGGQVMFIGNPALYHTQFDNSLSKIDVEYTGKILTEFAINFQDDEYEKDVVAFGVAPCVFIIEKDKMKSICYGVVFAAVALLFSLNIDKATVFLCIKALVSMLLCFFAFAFLVNMVNTVSYASNILLWFFLIVFFGTLIFLSIIISSNETSIDTFLAFHTILDVFFLFLFADMDISLIFLLSIIPQILHIVFHRVHYIFDVLFFFIEIIPFAASFPLIFPVVIGYTVHLKGIQADLFPFITMAFYSVHLSFTLMGISHCPASKTGQKSKFFMRNAFLLLSFSIFLGACLKKKPYSGNYPLLVSIAECIDENLTSTISLIPIAENRILQGLKGAIKKNTNITYEYNFQRFNIKGPAFVLKTENSTIPGFLNIKQLPEFSFQVKQVVNGQKIINFMITDNVRSTDYNDLILIAHCKNEAKCVSSVNSMKKFKYSKTEEGETLCIIKHNPCHSGISLKIVLNTTKDILFDVLFVSPKVTANRKDFKKSFELFVQHFDNPGIISDTIIYYKRYI